MTFRSTAFATERRTAPALRRVCGHSAWNAVQIKANTIGLGSMNRGAVR